MPFRRRPPPSSLTLKRASGRPDWLALLLRILLVFALIGVVLAAHWLDRGGLRDNLDGEISFTDVLYFTMVTVTTVGFGDIVPVTDRARMFDTFLVTPIRIFVWLIFLGTAYQFLLRNVWEAWVMNRIQDRLHDHVIVAGFGTSGEETVRELIRRGFPPQRIVVIDVRPTALAEAESLGVAVLEGDATRNATLAAVKIERANCVAVSAGRDDTSILIVLTARGMAPQRRDQRRGQGRGQRGPGAPGRRHHRHQPGELRRAPPRRLGARAAHRRVPGRPRRHRRQRRAARAAGHRRRGRPAALGHRHRPRRQDLPRRQVLRLLGHRGGGAAARRHDPRDRAARRASTA